MSSTDGIGVLANLPAEELMQSLHELLTAVVSHLPERRLRQVGILAVRGVLAVQSPVLTEMARAANRKMS
jgi:hypothetical protein